MQTIDETDFNVGEARRAITSSATAGSRSTTVQYVLVQSTTKTVAIRRSAVVLQPSTLDSFRR
jgi:hypothetical protein